MPFSSQLGWTFLSREALQRAEAQLSGENRGVVDELGLLEIHQAYADHFFPGTTVLQTRLRYVLFVAWIYDELLHGHDRRAEFENTLADREQQLATTLVRNTDGWGVIGRTTLPRMPGQRPSMIYWNSLNRWGVLHRHPDGAVPSRREVHTRIAVQRSATDLHDAEHRRLESDGPLFLALPDRPADWPKGPAIDFRLTPKEQYYLRTWLSRVSNDTGNDAALLARLAENGVGNQLGVDSPMWCKAVMDVAGGDRTHIKRARQAASLSAVVRALYLAMVEALANRDVKDNRQRCLENLRAVVADHGQRAVKLELAQLQLDLGADHSVLLMRLLDGTQHWLEKPDFSPQGVLKLHGDYLRQEQRLKGNRARLSIVARDRRREWLLDKAREEERLPEPLHFRWHIVRNLLRDLENRGV